MNKEELLSAIAKTNKVIGNDTMPEAVKEVARNTKAKLEAQLAELEKGETPEPKKEEPKKEEPKKEEPKKEKPQYKKKIVEKKIIMPKKETPKDNQKEAEKSMEGKKLTVENCRELLAKLKTKRESAKKRLETRKKQGKPAELTTIEALTSASATLEKKVEKEVEKKGQLPKSTLKRSTKEVVDIVATIISGIPTKAERTSYINEVIADLKKLIDKVEPITEKMERGGYMADGGIVKNINEDLVTINAKLKRLEEINSEDAYRQTQMLRKQKSALEALLLIYDDEPKNTEIMYKAGQHYPKSSKGGYMAQGGILDDESKYKIDNGFLKRDMNEILNRLLPYNFGFKVFKPMPRPNELTPNYDDAPSTLYGYDDKDIKSKLYFPQYKRDHDINFKITQGGENTYFDFYLNDSEGNPWIGTFGFKDRGDVDSTYITKFIAFLMECYALPFQVNHSVMAKGGDVNYRKNWEVTYITLQGTKGKKVITLGRMSDRDDVKNQLKRMDLNIREVTSIKEI